MTETDDWTTVESPEEMPDSLDFGPLGGWACMCGGCEEWVKGYTRVDTHLRILWHQWQNHRERIREEY
jgi:hypothetical protein